MTEEKLDDIGTWLKSDPKQCLCFLLQKCCVSETSVHVTTKPFYVLAEQTPILTEISCRWLVGTQLVFHLYDEACFILSGCFITCIWCWSVMYFRGMCCFHLLGLPCSYVSSKSYCKGSSEALVNTYSITQCINPSSWLWPLLLGTNPSVSTVSSKQHCQSLPLHYLSPIKFQHVQI